jgi:S-adenosylmethionine:tRNA ribosyltransferase-isomerase
MGKRGRRILKFSQPYSSVFKYGYAPLPPYIKRKFSEAVKYKEFDLARYQTVYSSHPGSIAAPTAGLHLTKELLGKIKKKIDVFEISLEVGEATFEKIEVQHVEEHKMGSETITIIPDIKNQIVRSKKKKNLIAVGTTSVRALETLAQKEPETETFSSDLFIYPGFEFQMVDKLITNFHLPESSLFILVSAFAGLELLKEAYRIAIKEGYCFFSYGDAMFII